MIKVSRTPNCFDSLPDAWKHYGNYIKAKENYEKALNLARKQNDSKATGIAKRLHEIIKLINKQND